MGRYGSRFFLIGCSILLFSFLIGHCSAKSKPNKQNKPKHGPGPGPGPDHKNVADVDNADDFDKDCKHNDHSIKRFDKRMLKKHCDKKKSWTTSALQSVGKTVMSVLSPKQQDYLTSVMACTDLFCLCDKVPLCKSVKDVFGNLGSLVTRGLNRVNDPDHPSTGNSLVDNLADKVKGVGDFFNKLGIGRMKRDINDRSMKPAIRKEYRRLTDDERNRFHAALNRLKFSMIDDKSKYDILTMYHSADYSPGAHFGPALLPFHRELLRNLETGLRFEDSDVGLPYWDSTLDDGLPNPADSILWTENFLGNGQGAVITGFMANWTVLENPKYVLSKKGGKVVRACGSSSYGTMYQPQDLDWIRSRTEFRQLTYCVDNFFELLHGGIHTWVGGHMAELEISPNDPSFFMHHNFIDYLFEDWRLYRQNRTARETEYVPNAEQCNSLHAPDADMKPFKIKNIGGMSNNYTDQMYVFEPRPTCNATSPDCGSPYLWCDTNKYRCHSKVRLGGNCTGFADQGICFQSICSNNKCLPTAPPDQTTHTTTPVWTTTTFPGESTVSTVATTTTTEAATTGSTKPSPNVDTAQTVWFPITILQQTDDGNSAPLTAAIISFALQGTKNTFVGELGGTGDNYPNFPGNAFVQVPSPEIFPDGRVTGSLLIGTGGGQTCTALCYQDPDANDGVSYVNCEGTVTVDVDPSKTGNLTYTPYRERVPFVSWIGPIRKPTRFLFICPTDAAAPVTNSTAIDAIINATTNGTQNVVEEVDESCTNRHRCCPYWSSVGECARNYIWMGTSCQKSCQICGTSESTAGTCRDFFDQCTAWAEDSQCQQNANWMEENCQKSCGTCGRTENDLAPLCGGHVKSDECKDWYGEDCAPWSQSGECTKNKWWMEQNCPLSCGVCTSTKPTQPTSTA